MTIKNYWLEQIEIDEKKAEEDKKKAEDDKLQGVWVRLSKGNYNDPGPEIPQPEDINLYCQNLLFKNAEMIRQHFSVHKVAAGAVLNIPNKEQFHYYGWKPKEKKDGQQ